MDTPKRAVSLLESLPPDIWAYVVWYLPGEQLGRLMITGATFLWQRMKSPKVVRSIKLGKDFMIFKSYPRFLNEFPSLQELLIHSCNYEWSGALGLTISSVPSGVRKLQFSGSWNPSSNTLFGENGATLKLDEHLPNLEVLDLHCVTLSSYSWMSHSPQSLTKLRFERWDGDVELPSSLTDFEAFSVTLSVPTFVSKLPPSLESFVVITHLDGIDLLMPLFPSSLRNLTLGSMTTYDYDDRSSPLRLIEQLPKLLTRLTIQSSETDEVVSFYTNPEFTALLPATLTELYIGPWFPASAWPLLPPKITKLSFGAGDLYSPDLEVHQLVKSIPFDSFPKSTTSLTFLLASHKDQYFCGLPPISHTPYFPSQLTELGIPDIQLCPETAKLLPPSLTFLEIGNFCERVCEHLPTGLRTLKSGATLMSPNLVKFLPKSLTYLNLSFPKMKHPWFDHNTGERIDTILKLPDYSLHISLPNANEFGDSFMLHQRLPNLLELRLPESRHYTDLSIPLLSPSLTTLNLDSSSKVSGKSFEFLPRSLKFLSLNSSESIFDSDIQHMPRTLKQVSFDRALFLTDLCIGDLPPHLEMLIMRSNSQITTACFSSLPYPLRSSQTNRSLELATWHIKNGEASNRRLHLGGFYF